jgi:hypothetical protein
MFFPAADTIAFSEGGVESMRLNSSGVLVTTNDASISGLTVGKGAGALTQNTAFGVTALAATSSSYNSAFGYRALLTNTTGTDNNAFGQASLQLNTTGSENLGIGSGALYLNTTGSNNSAIGYQALLSNTTASNNTAVGYQAGYTNVTGTNSTYIGRQAGFAATGGSNTFVGSETGESVTTGSSNAFFGEYAGQGATTGTYNTFVGAESGYLMTTGSKNTILGSYNGNQGGLDIRTASNHIVLSDGDGNPRGVINPSGFLKVAASTSLIGPTGAYHEFNSGTADTMLRLTNSNGNPFGMVVDFTGANPNANSNAYITCQDTSGVRLRVWSNGNVQNSNNSYGSLSDQSVKENIIDATPKLADLMQVKIRNFNLIGDETKQIGVVAQELETVFPSMVEEDEDGIKGVKYSVFVPMLIKAVQELNAKVEAQALEIATLKGN